MISTADMPDPKVTEMVAKSKRFQTLCRNVLGSGQGKELLEQLVEIYADGPLFHESERTTTYCLGQRDLIKELEYNVKMGKES